jgi:hypothetical protein
VKGSVFAPAFFLLAVVNSTSPFRQNSLYQRRAFFEHPSPARRQERPSPSGHYAAKSSNDNHCDFAALAIPISLGQLSDLAALRNQPNRPIQCGTAAMLPMARAEIHHGAVFFRRRRLSRDMRQCAALKLSSIRPLSNFSELGSAHDEP